MQIDVTRKVLRVVEASGDTATYIRDICESFFDTMVAKSECFLELFVAHLENAAIISLFINWTHSQITAFVKILAKQIMSGVQEHAAIVITQFRLRLTG